MHGGEPDRPPRKDAMRKHAISKPPDVPLSHFHATTPSHASSQSLLCGEANGLQPVDHPFDGRKLVEPVRRVVLLDLSTGQRVAPERDAQRAAEYVRLGREFAAGGDPLRACLPCRDGDDARRRDRTIAAVASRSRPLRQACLPDFIRCLVCVLLFAVASDA